MRLLNTPAATRPFGVTTFVSALPFSVARNLFSDARLSADKKRVVRELKYFPVDKVFLQMQQQFWRANGQSGFANTDLRQSSVNPQ